MAFAETVGLGQLIGAVAKLGVPPQRYEVLLARYKVLLVAESRRCFDEATDPGGRPWLKLKRPRSRPRDRRAKGGSGQKPLRDRGLLMMSVTAQVAGPTSLVWGSNHPHARTHQEGRTISVPERRREKPWVFEGDRGPVFTKRIRAHTVTIPARPFVGVSPRLADRMLQMAAEFTAAELKARALRA